MKESFGRLDTSLFSRNNESQTGIVLNLYLKWNCKDENGNQLTDGIGVGYYGGSTDGYYALTSKGFDTIITSSINYCMMPSDTTYVVIIDPSQGIQEKRYPISRKIPPGDVERFHIMIGSTTSSYLNIKFAFHIDESEVIESEPFDIKIWKPRNSRLNHEYKDGEHIDRHLAELKEKNQTDSLAYWERDSLMRLQKQKNAYPFTKPNK